MIGIYAIINTVNGYHYVGQSVQMEDRFNKHRSSLRIGRHRTPHLQSAWDKYGEESFLFVVVCLTTREPDDICRAEDFWMRQCKERGITLYNTSPTSKSRLGVPMSEEFKRRQSLARKGVPQPEKRNISFGKTMRGRKNPKEWCELMSVIMKSHPKAFKSGGSSWNKGKKYRCDKYHAKKTQQELSL